MEEQRIETDSVVDFAVPLNGEDDAAVFVDAGDWFVEERQSDAENVGQRGPSAAAAESRWSPRNLVTNLLPSFLRTAPPVAGPSSSRPSGDRSAPVRRPDRADVVRQHQGYTEPRARPITGPHSRSFVTQTQALPFSEPQRATVPSLSVPSETEPSWPVPRGQVPSGPDSWGPATCRPEP